MNGLLQWILLLAILALLKMGMGDSALAYSLVFILLVVAIVGDRQ